MPYVIYGDRQIQFEVPEGLRLTGLLEPRSLPVKGEPLYEGKEAICKAISPEALPSLGKGSRILILVDDDTRPTPLKVIAPFLIRALRRIGIEDTRITFLIALGLHPPMAEREIEERLGLEIVRGFQVLNHDPDGGLEFLGRTSKGIDVWVNDLIPKADLKIGIVTLAMYPSPRL